MSDFVASGHIVDLVLVIVAIEVVALMAYRRVTGRGLAAADLIPNALAGAALLIALRCALVDAPWSWIAASLSAAGVAHLVDVAARWRS